MSALANKVSELGRTLQLSHDQVAEIVGANGRSVARWNAGTATPQPLTRQRLLELAYVAELLAEVLRAEDANLWLFSPNRLLDHDTPAKRIHDGDYRSVLALIEALADGVAV